MVGRTTKTRILLVAACLGIILGGIEGLGVAIRRTVLSGYAYYGMYRLIALELQKSLGTYILLFACCIVAVIAVSIFAVRRLGVSPGRALATAALVVIIAAVIVPTNVPHLDMTPSDHSLLDAESQLASTIGREFILRKALTRARTYYDFILIDCPPNLGNLTVNAYVASDYLLIPCDLSALALEGMEGILDVVDTVNLRLNHPLRLLGVLTTRVDRRNLVMNEAVFERLKEVFNDKLFRTQISVNTDLNKAQLAGKPIFTYARSSAGAKDYQAFADEVIERLQTLSNAAGL